jgi:GalNAc5-diNAcBac-PP-undecaprenol beta-1,3-glucosyltransferase
LAQDFTDLEVIVVDDGSKDATRDVVMEFQNRDARVKYISQENSERGAARNKGFRQAQGKYVIFFDSDDVMLPDHLSVLKAVIDRFPGIRFLSTKFRLMDGDNPIPLTIDSITEGWYDGTIYLTGTHTGVMIAINRENPALHLFEEDRRYATLEDWMFLTQNILRERIYIIDKYTVLVNNHDQRSSRIDNQGVIRKRLLACDWIKAHVQLSEAECNKLEGYSYRFCAIHAYLDNARIKGFSYAWKAIRKSGPDKQLLLLMGKIALGHKVIQLLKK